MIKIRNITLVFALVILSGCNTLQSLTKSTHSENFEEFSIKFYTDSLFQLSRINFPLKGLYNIEVPETPKNPIGDSIITSWKKNDWNLLKNDYFKNNESKVVIENNTYLRKIKKSSKTVIIKTYIENSGFSVTEKFALKKDKWYLIYFSSLNY